MSPIISPTGGGSGGSQPVQTAEVTLSSAQILALHTTPVQFVAAPVAGKWLMPVLIVYWYLAGTTPYVVGGSSFLIGWGVLNPNTATGSLRMDGLVDTVYLWEGPAEDYTNVDASLITGDALAVGLSGPFTGGDGTVRMTTTYLTLDLP